MLRKYFTTYKRMSAPVKMAFWFLICNFFQKGIGMLTTPLFTRIMTESEYGRYNVYNSWCSIFTVFVTLSISGNCFTRGLVVAEGKQKQRELASSFYGLGLTILALYIIVYLLFSNYINTVTGLSSYLFLMMGVDFVTVQASNLWINSKRVNYEYKGIIVLTFLITIMRPLIAILLVLHSSETAQVEARLTGVAISNILLFSWIIIYIFAKGKKYYIRDNWKYALSFCIPLIPHYLSQTILNQSDRIMISRYIGNAEAGYYSVAYTIAAIIFTFNSAIAQTLDPWIYQSIKNKSLDRIGPISYKLTAIIALMNFSVMIIAPEVLTIMAPNSYHNALWVIPPVTASVFFQFMYDLFASFQFYFKKTKWIAIGSCIGAVLNIILNAVFIPVFGFVAAGYTTMVCYVIFGVLHYFFMRKVCKEYLDGYKIYDWKKIFGMGFVLVLMVFLINILYNQSIIIRYFIFAGMIIIGIINRRKISSLFKTVKAKEDV
ncbi:MAG: oligosaccharide flippase family protein [Clostridia bacterium]|nr:oligosaccharide flippase family protein [Clostridia bacterium]